MAEQKMQSSETAGPCVVEGIYFPDFMSYLKDRIPQLRQMKLRDDDVILCTYPKSGTNWLWEVITMLRKGRPEHEKISMPQLNLEAVTMDKLQELPSPRTLTSHLPFSMLPVAEMKARRVKVVHVYRNPKDTCVSFFTFINAAAYEVKDVPTDAFEKYFEHYFFSREQFYGPYFRHIQQVHEFQQQNPDVSILSLSFEDTKKDPMGCVKKLAQFLCLTVSDELCSQIAQACSFDNMKEKEPEKATPDLGDEELIKILKLDQQNFVFCRKGQIGDWKNYFTVAMNERVDDLIKQEMEGLPFTLSFE